MTTLSAAKMLLQADSTLLALATGGIYTPDDLGRLGLNKSNAACASAFSGVKMQPCLVLKLGIGSEVAGLGDDGRQTTAQRQMMQVWCYDDNGYSTIESMMMRIYLALQGKKLDNAICRWNFDSPQLRDNDLDAMVRRSDFAVYGLK